MEKVKIKRLLTDSYSVECYDVSIMNQIKRYLAEKEIGGFDKSDNKSALFHTDKVLKGVVGAACLTDITLKLNLFKVYFCS